MRSREGEAPAEPPQELESQPTAQQQLRPPKQLFENSTDAVSAGERTAEQPCRAARHWIAGRTVSGAFCHWWRSTEDDLPSGKRLPTPSSSPLLSRRKRHQA